MSTQGDSTKAKKVLDAGSNPLIDAPHDIQLLILKHILEEEDLSISMWQSKRFDPTKTNYQVDIPSVFFVLPRLYFSIPTSLWENHVTKLRMRCERRVRIKPDDQIVRYLANILRLVCGDFHARKVPNILLHPSIDLPRLREIDLRGVENLVCRMSLYHAYQERAGRYCQSYWHLHHSGHS